ncbi:MAG TPA: DUF6390 family protein [Thermoplasmata archaeon]|nr:DUF6390 family protein [Thermoplasmata archaeon]
MDDGVRLGARFSLATNRLNYCGPEGAERWLHRAIVTGEGTDVARRALAGFEALVPYLDAIARKHGRDRFDRDVVEAYWVGNPLLDAFDRSDFVRILGELVERGLPRSLADRLAAGLPERPLPHHAFHVAYVGVGNVTGHVATTVPNIEACRPGWGTVTAVTGDRIDLDRSTVALRDGRLALGPTRPAALAFDPAVLPGVRAGDVVAVHWEMPVLVLSAEQAANLRRYTEASFAAAGPIGAPRPPRPA